MIYGSNILRVKNENLFFLKNGEVCKMYSWPGLVWSSSTKPIIATYVGPRGKFIIIMGFSILLVKKIIK